MKDEEIFLNYINNHYQLLKNKYRKFCKEKDYQWDEDIYSDTILKCYEAIERKGKMEDPSDQGIENYFFRSFKQNLQREKQYCRVSKRDLNIKSDDINQMKNGLIIPRTRQRIRLNETYLKILVYYI